MIKHGFAVAAGWVLAALVLYGCLLLLDVYWNIVNWTPRADWPTLLLLAGTAAGLAGAGFLARTTSHPLAWVVSGCLCLFLLIAGAYATSPEPLTNGLFGREVASPLWYRGGRLALMSLPLLCWTFAVGKRVRCNIRPSSSRTP